MNTEARSPDLVSTISYRDNSQIVHFSYVSDSIPFHVWYQQCLKYITELACIVLSCIGFRDAFRDWVLLEVVLMFMNIEILWDVFTKGLFY